MWLEERLVGLGAEINEGNGGRWLEWRRKVRVMSWGMQRWEKEKREKGSLWAGGCSCGTDREGMVVGLLSRMRKGLQEL